MLTRANVRVGDFITYDGRHGNVWTAKVTAVGTYRLSYMSADGVSEMMEDTQYRDYSLDDYRYATDEEIAEYERRYRPAPQNWL